MSVQDDGTYDEAAARRSRRRKQAAVGAAGVAAVLAGGAFFVTEARTAKEVITPDVASAPLTLPPSPTVTVQPTVKRTTAPASTRPSAKKVARTTSPKPPPPDEAAREEVEKAREKAARDGVPVQRPVPPVTKLTTPVDLRITESGSLKKDGRTLRVVSARSDLTGYRELAWPAGDTERVGVATCSQTFKFANNAEAERKPNLLICWRTGAKRSVYTVLVELDGDPSREASLAALTRRWNSMG